MKSKPPSTLISDQRSTENSDLDKQNKTLKRMILRLQKRDKLMDQGIHKELDVD